MHCQLTFVYKEGVYLTWKTGKPENYRLGQGMLVKNYNFDSVLGQGINKKLLKEIHVLT